MLKIKYHIVIIFISFTCAVSGQFNPSYSINNENVIFNFDIRDYKKLTKDNTSKRIDADNLDIQNVSVSGQFNNWSRQHWKMEKTGLYTYQLIKKITDFDERCLWEFKFLVNNEYWAEPDKTFYGITESEKSYLWRKVYNLTMYTMSFEEGNAHFYLEGYKDAKKVIVTGSFNGWNESQLEMKSVKGGWKSSLNLKPETYEYKFIVDGKWMEDPKNAHKEYNEHRTFNSILRIRKEVVFELQGYENASKITLAGSFNNWDKKEVKMKKEEDGNWRCRLTLEGGKHHYKYIVDGKWIVDPDNPVQEHDEYGNINSVKMVN